MYVFETITLRVGRRTSFAVKLGINTKRKIMFPLATEHEHAQEFSNYDVLLAKAQDRSIILDTKRHHVGNNRFQVLLNMHRQDFEDRLTAGESTDPVVKKLIDIICRQCEPAGRFLISEGKQSWMVLTAEEAETFIAEYLSSPHATKTLMANPEALTGSMPASKAPPVVPNEGDLRATITSPPSSDGEKKRRRRSSLLRRSLSEGGWDKKKSGRRSVRFPTNWVPKFLGHNNKTSTDDATKARADNLDVVFNTQLTALSTSLGQHTGNNRLAVMIDMQRRAFTGGDDAAKEKMVQDVVNTVSTAWNGKFLAENDMGKGFLILNKDDERVKTGIRCLFDPSIAPEPSNSNDQALLSSATPSKKPDPRRPSFVKHKTLQALHQFAPSSQMQELRSGAVASLQKRKQRQGVTHKIRNLAQMGARATTNTDGSLAPGAGLNRATSAPVQNYGMHPHPPQYHDSQFAHGAIMEDEDDPLMMERPPVLQTARSAPTGPMLYEQTDATIQMDGMDLVMHSGPGNPSNDAVPAPEPGRLSTVSQLSEGMIENLLSGLDVSEAEFHPES